MPLTERSTDPAPQRGFIPLQAEEDRPSMAKMLALENPATAIAETGLNLATQGVALPVAGLAGLATEAGRAMGMTERTGADVVHNLGEALTYMPRGEMGKAATELATYPFQKLAEAGQAVGGKVLDTTGSPLLATAADTAINALPIVIDPAIRAAKKAKTAANVAGSVGVTPAEVTPKVTPESRGFVPLEDAAQADVVNLRNQNTAPDRGLYGKVPESALRVDSVDHAPRGFQPLKEMGDGEQVASGTGRMATDDQPMLRPGEQGFPELRAARDRAGPGNSDSWISDSLAQPQAGSRPQEGARA